MDDRHIHERSEGAAESIGPEAEGRLQAAAGAWQAWLVAAGAVLVAGDVFARSASGRPPQRRSTR